MSLKSAGDLTLRLRSVGINDAHIVETLRKYRHRGEIERILRGVRQPAARKKGGKADKSLAIAAEAQVREKLLGIAIKEMGHVPQNIVIIAPKASVAIDNGDRNPLMILALLQEHCESTEEMENLNTHTANSDLLATLIGRIQKYIGILEMHNTTASEQYIAAWRFVLAKDLCRKSVLTQSLPTQIVVDTPNDILLVEVADTETAEDVLETTSDDELFGTAIDAGERDPDTVIQFLLASFGNDEPQRKAIEAITSTSSGIALLIDQLFARIDSHEMTNMPVSEALRDAWTLEWRRSLTPRLVTITTTAKPTPFPMAIVADSGCEEPSQVLERFHRTELGTVAIANNEGNLDHGAPDHSGIISVPPKVTNQVRHNAKAVESTGLQDPGADKNVASELDELAAITVLPPQSPLVSTAALAPTLPKVDSGPLRLFSKGHRSITANPSTFRTGLSLAAPVLFLGLSALFAHRMAGRNPTRYTEEIEAISATDATNKSLPRDLINPMTSNYKATQNPYASNRTRLALAREICVDQQEQRTTEQSVVVFKSARVSPQSPNTCIQGGARNALTQLGITEPRQLESISAQAENAIRAVRAPTVHTQAGDEVAMAYDSTLGIWFVKHLRAGQVLAQARFPDRDHHVALAMPTPQASPSFFGRMAKKVTNIWTGFKKLFS